MNTMCKIIYISGIVGSGKSFIGELMSQKYHIPFLKEPVSVDQINLYYSGQMRAIDYQNMVVTNKFHSIKQMIKSESHILVERCFDEDQIFCE